MEAYFPPIIGISVSVFLFLIGYRKTIGARKERVNTANISVHRALLRRMVLEGYHPRLDDISRLLEGKAKEFQARTADLMSEEQVLIKLYTEIFDNDIIPPQLRTDLEKRLDEVFNKIEQEPKVEESFLSQERPVRVERMRIVVVMGALTSLLGAMTTFFAAFAKEGQTDLRKLFLVSIVFLTSLAIVALITLLRRTRESVEDVSRVTGFQAGLALERNIVEILKQLGIPYALPHGPRDPGVDFIVDIKGKKIAIEAKAWSLGVPLRMIVAMVEQMNVIKQNYNLDRVLIVLPSARKLPSRIDQSSGVEILSVGDLSAYLRRLMAPE